MCGNRAIFSRLDENFKHSVKLDNNTRMEGDRKSDVKLLINGINHIITEVYYVPELKKSLEHRETSRERLDNSD